MEYGGKRFNNGKPRMELLVPEAMVAEAKVWEMGAEKYGEFNWQKGMAWSTVIGCAMRHLTAIMRGEDYDSESGLPHAAHLATNASMLIYYLEHFKEGDDRINTRKPLTEDQKVKMLETVTKPNPVAIYSDVNDADLDREVGTVCDPALLTDEVLVGGIRTKVKVEL